jgi:hypothetical protein
MNRVITLAMLFLALSVAACKDLSTETDVWPSNSELIYYNSFESKADTIGWRTLASFEFVPDSPVGGGSQSVRVSGGCPVPNATTRVNNHSKAGKCYLECFGKNLANGGSVRLNTTSEPFTGKVVRISDTNWVRYQAEGSLECSANDTLQLTIHAGGDNPSAILVDCIRIYRSN